MKRTNKRKKKKRKEKIKAVVVGGGGVKANCLIRDPGLWVECLPLGVFLRDPSPYLRKEIKADL